MWCKSDHILSNIRWASTAFQGISRAAGHQIFRSFPANSGVLVWVQSAIKGTTSSVGVTTMQNIWLRTKNCTCVVCIGLMFCVSPIIAATESADCERAICRNVPADTPHTHDEDHSPSPVNQKFSADVTSSGSGTTVHLTAENLTVGHPEFGTPELNGPQS
jgi:hypothetical protein